MKLPPKQVKPELSHNEFLAGLEKKLKEQQKKQRDSHATCPYGCGWSTKNKYRKAYVSENLRHLLGCVKQNPDDREKLKAYFS